MTYPFPKGVARWCAIQLEKTIAGSATMINYTLLFILGGCVLGAIQLVAGLALGMWIRRSNTADARRGRQDMIEAGLIARRLQDLADELSTSASEHRSQLDHASQLLTTGEGGSDEALAELVVNVIGDVVRANQDLQSKLDSAENRLEEQAAEIEAHISRSLTDPLTGLPNRREFNDRLEERMAAWNRRQEPFSLLMIDVDHFKKLNDAHGHLAGDQVLAAIGHALRGAVRREDAVARYGGEEFAILLPNTSLDQAVKVVQNVHDAISRVAVHRDGKNIAVTVSGGLAMIGASEHADSLIGRADAALYSAKAAGRDRTFVHDGVHSVSVSDFQCQKDRPSGPAARLIELIHSADGADAVVAGLADPPSYEFGTYLAREAISAGLAQTCEELRRFVDERGQRQQDAAQASRSQ
jgi:diguanylate cyclase (GGDEF)-like protein